MAKGGRRYPLVVYTHMIDRWWPAILALGGALGGLSWALYSWGFEQWRWLIFASIGAFCFVTGLFLLLIRKAAYVQPFSDHLKIATPLLRLNISYRRFQRTTSANMGILFPSNSVTKWQSDIIQPIAKMTAIVISVNAMPMSQTALRFFLSPLFFKDKTPHIVILVKDWMKLSAELESMRSGSGSSPSQQRRENSILSRLPGKDK